MKKQSLIFFMLFLIGQTYSQNFSVAVGTDIPYQHYLGINMELKHIDISYRTGVLVPPYSDAILGILESFGTDKIYIDLLDASYNFGWMNSIGAYYKFGSKKNWYVGPEFRVDYLTASDTPKELIEAASGQTINKPNFITKDLDLKLGLRLNALGLRVGRNISLGTKDKHSIKTEFSISKHIASQSTLQGNGNNLEKINVEIDKLLWDDVFKTYGYVGGIGFAYSYKF